MATSTEKASAEELLRLNLDDPFWSDVEAPDHVRPWFELLRQGFPLWSFQADAYWGLHGSDLPATYPLAQMVESILRDEGLNDGHHYLEPLPATIDRRRQGLWLGRIQPMAYITAEEYWGRGTGFHRGACHFRPRSVASVPYQVAWGDEGPEGDYSPYDDVGEELVWLVEGLGRARNTKERKSAQKKLDRFLKQIAAKLGAGRPAAALTKKLALPLVRAGRDLLSLCWRVLPARPSEYTRMLLAEYGISDKEECDLWATRLALPVLSLPEIEGLLSQRETADGWSRAESRPTPRVFTIWVLARRVGMQARGLARKTLGSKAEQYFVGKSNPIDATGGQ